MGDADCSGCPSSTGRTKDAGASDFDCPWRWRSSFIRWSDGGGGRAASDGRRTVSEWGEFDDGTSRLGGEGCGLGAREGGAMEDISYRSE